MKSKIVPVLIISLVIQNCFFYGIILMPQSSAITLPECLVVGPGELYEKIQDAINTSHDGDMIYVTAGYTYYEHLTVNKSIDLVGADKYTTIIDGSGIGTVVTITVDNVNLNNFMITNGGSDIGDAGIKLASSNFTTITDNIIYFNGYAGILITSSNNDTVNRNDILVNEEYGIKIQSSSDMTIIANNITEGKHSIDVWYSTRTIVSQNIVSSNMFAISFLTSSNNIITENEIYDIIYFGISVGSSSYDNDIISNTIHDLGNAGILLYTNSYDNTLTENIIYNISGDGAGVYLQHSPNNTLTSNILFNNTIGIYAFDSNNIVISSNSIFNNSQDGININQSNDMSISENFIFNNTWNGVNIDYYSCNNTIFNNTIYGDLYSGITIKSFSMNTSIRNNIIFNNTFYGIVLYSHANYNTIQSNYIFNNFHTGIVIISYSTYNTVNSNYVIDNGVYGIALLIVTNNLIYDNYFDNNDYELDSAATTWNITKTSGSNIVGGAFIGGNYWSDYTGNDTDHDGIGDTSIPYTHIGEIDEGGDYLPLILSPHATSISPENYSTNIPVTTNIDITFDQVMNKASVEDNLSVSPTFSYTASWTIDEIRAPPL